PKTRSVNTSTWTNGYVRAIAYPPPLLLHLRGWAIRRLRALAAAPQVLAGAAGPRGRRPIDGGVLGGLVVLLVAVAAVQQRHRRHPVARLQVHQRHALRGAPLGRDGAQRGADDDPA